MKTIHNLFATILVFVSMPFANAQWSAVRFDDYNVFLKVCAATENTVFVIGAEPVNYTQFVLKTNDAGATWDSVIIGTANDTFQLTALSFLDKNNGFLGGTRNSMQVLLKTIDNGTGWTEITPDAFSSNNIVAIDFIDNQIGFASDGTTIYKTVNGGGSWTSQTTSFRISDIHFIDLNKGFACGTDLVSAGPALVMKTLDGGLNWSTSLSKADPLLFVSEFAKLDFVNPDTGFIFLRNTNKLFKTMDGGISWDTIVKDSIWAINDVDFRSAAIGHLLSLDGKIIATADGGATWTIEYETEWHAYGFSVYLNSLSFVEGAGYVGGSNGLIKKYTANNHTGIKEENLNGTVLIYPHPFSSSTTIKISESKFTSHKFVLYNVLGKELRKSEITGQQFEIYKGDLPNGVYFYRISNGEVSLASGRLVIQ